MRSLHFRRGQAYPIWMGALFVYIMSISVLNFYGDIFAAQVRAQNAADSAASAVVSVQSQEWNEMIATLYLNDVEEYRTRNVLESLRLAANHDGGCNPSLAAPNAASCAQTYNNLKLAYMKSLTRYNNNVAILSQITTTSNFANIYNDGQILLQMLKKPCGNSKINVPNALDCSMTYSMPAQGFTTRPEAGNANFYPQYMHLESYFDNGVTSATPWLMAPIAVEVAACTRVYPMLSSFLGKSLIPSFEVIARGAATDSLVSENWLSPGMDNGPSGTVYQPKVSYGPNNSAGENWYSVDYGGQTFAADPNTQKFTSTGGYQVGMSSRMGWWGPVPIHSFMGRQSDTALFGNGGCPG